MKKLISNAKDAEVAFRSTHPYALISHIMDFVGENFGNNEKVFIRKLNGKTPDFYEIKRLWNEGRLCWCIL